MKSETSNLLSKENIMKHLPGKLNSLPVFVYEEIDSTNNEAKKLVANGSLTNGLLITTHQTNGRGRVGHNFFSPREGLYMTYVYTPENLTHATHATTKASVCVTESIKKLYGIDAKIKWVNDIYYNDKKVCGILTEAVTKGINTGSLVIGIGINFSKAAVPVELENIMGFLPDDPSVTKEMLAGNIIGLLHEELLHIENTDYIKKYRSASLLTGKDISYIENDVAKTAKVLDVDDSAGLVVLLPDGTTSVLRSGEVFTIRKVN